jgi:putative thiamine transport system permease protein
VFVLPYVFLAMVDPWRAFDQRYVIVALSLGASPLRALLTIRLPMLMRACLAAAAIGIAVSVGQFLATQLVAGARWPSITTEAVAMSSGGNRRTLAIYAVLQTLLPLVAFLMATLLPAYLFRNRRGMGSA